MILCTRLGVTATQAPFWILTFSKNIEIAQPNGFKITSSSKEINIQLS